jgi:hypothetical protein
MPRKRLDLGDAAWDDAGYARGDGDRCERFCVKVASSLY